MRAWTGREVRLVRELYAKCRREGTVAMLAAELNRSVGSVISRAYLLGLTDRSQGQSDRWERESA